MGQQSVKEVAPSQLVMVHEKLQKHALELKQAATVPYDTFLESIQELNKITHSFSDIAGKILVFQVKKGTDSSMLWRGIVRVKCHKVSSRTGTIESCRLLNLKQYTRLHNEITRQASMATLANSEGQTAEPTIINASVIFTELEGHEEAQEEECCICMDRKAVVILPCSHIYCEQCIDEWNVNHKTCPICRATVQSSDDTWVLTEKPDKCEMAYETTGYLMGLADRTGSPAHTPSDN